MGWTWASPSPFFPCLGVPTVPSPHSSAGSEQHLQEKWLFLSFLGVTGSLIPTVFIPVPQCCLSREGWALLLPHRGTGSSSAPSFNPNSCRVQGSMGSSAASTAHCTAQPVHPALLALDILTLCSGSWHDAIAQPAGGCDVGYTAGSPQLCSVCAEHAAHVGV